MYFNRSFSPVEVAFLISFILIYGYYFARTFWFAYRLRTTAPSALLKFFLRTACFGLMLTALLEPSFGESERALRAVGRDVFLLVDVSKSMDATDVQPTRLEKVKFELGKLLDAFPSDRFGLIIFTSGAFVQCPLTFDHGALRLFIESLNTDLVSAQGTAFTPALSLAIEKLTQSAPTQSKAIVLITDGEDFGTTTTPELRLIRRNGINLFTVGIGTPTGSRIQTPQGFVKNADGQIVVSHLKADELGNLARSVNGTFVEVTDSQNGFPLLTERLNKLESQLIDQRQLRVVANKYAYFLVAALVLLSLDILVTVRTIRL